MYFNVIYEHINTHFMTENEIKYGFWHREKVPNFPPESIIQLDEYNPKENLTLFITQTNLKSTLQNKLIKDWCKKLPEMHEVKYLWFTSRVNQKMFDATCEMKNIEGLWIKWSGIKSIDNIENLKNLKHLHIGSSGQIESIEILKKLKSLETLELEQLNKISDFSIISELTHLEGLGIDGSIWTAQKIDTLKPIENLANLKYLTTTNSKIKDKSFDPILRLNNLVRFNCSWNYPETEFEKLKNIPNLKYGNIETSWKELKEKLKADIIKNVC